MVRPTSSVDQSPSRWPSIFEELESFRDHDRLAGEDPRCKVVRKRSRNLAEVFDGLAARDILSRFAVGGGSLRLEHAGQGDCFSIAAVRVSLEQLLVTASEVALGIEEGGAFPIVLGAKEVGEASGLFQILQKRVHFRQAQHVFHAGHFFHPSSSPPAA